jgi:hypothetical protein
MSDTVFTDPTQAYAPATAPEGSLNLSLADYRNRASFFLGYARDYNDNDADRQGIVDECVVNGLRAFYRAHDWLFLEPDLIVVAAGERAVGTATITGVYADSVTTLTASVATFYPSSVGAVLTITTLSDPVTITGYVSETVVTASVNATCSNKTFAISYIRSDGAKAFSLPDDFGYIVGPLDHPPSTFRPPMETTSEHMIRTRRMETDLVGIPRYFCVRLRPFVSTVGQRREIVVYPAPDGDYVLTCQYRINASAITDAAGYPYGEEMHAETIREAILAECELGVQDNIQGVHKARYAECLTRSIELDRQQAAETLGPMRKLGRRKPWQPRNVYGMRYTPSV